MVFKLLIVDDDAVRRNLLVAALASDSSIQTLALSDSLGVHVHAQEFAPNMVLVASESPARDVIEGLKGLGTSLPVVMLVDRASTDEAKEALRAGVAAYVVDGIDQSRIRSILALAVAQFTHLQELKEDLASVKRDLANRKDIDRAKALIMARRNMAEPEAYKLMRTAAMNQGKTMAEIAKNLLAAEALLGAEL